MLQKIPLMTMSDLEIPLVDDPADWEYEKGKEHIRDQEDPEPESIDTENLSHLAISYLSQMKDLQEQLRLEYLKVQRLEMAIKGFGISLQEELKKGQ